jgi:large repetitive protein
MFGWASQCYVRDKFPTQGCAMKNKKLWILAMVLIVAATLLSGCGGGSPSTNTQLPPPPALAITSTAPPSGTVGTAYAGNGFSLTASGGVAPYSWSWTAASSSSLPAGLNLSASGLISGTPQVAVTYDVTVTVTDSSSRPSHVSLDYKITVASMLSITSGAPPSGTVGVDYGPTIWQQLYCYDAGASVGARVVCRQCASTSECSSLQRCTGQGNATRPLPCKKSGLVFQGFTFTAAGGVAPYNWSASGMPPGIDVDASSGQILGTPTTAGSYSVLITVTDTASPPVQVSGTYVIDIN